MHHGVNAGLEAERFVLRDEDLGADDVALLYREHEGAAGRIGLHQAADVDVALGDDAVERGHDVLIELLLVQHLQLRLFRHDIGLRDRDRGLLCLQGLNVGGALLRGQPALLHQADRRDPR